MRTDTTCLILHAVNEETRIFSRVISWASTFRGKNVPGSHFGREGVDNGEDWRDVCTQRGGFMAFDIARWHVTYIQKRNVVLSVCHSLCTSEMYWILIMPYWSSSCVVASLQASTRCPKNCTVRFTFSHAIQTYWCLENVAFRLLVSSSARLV